jgi:hypothetical protein
MVEFDTLSSYHASSNYSAMHSLQAIPGQGEPHCAHLPDNTRVCQVRQTAKPSERNCLEAFWPWQQQQQP